MVLVEFLSKFPNENACVTYLKEKREVEGIKCKCCNKKTKHYWFKAQLLWKCADCGSRINLRAGTIMEKSKLPIQYWFVAIHLMTSIKKSFSALEMQRQLGHKRYEPIWLMMNKIRMSMGKRDKKYKLKGNIEVDDAYFEIVIDKEAKKGQPKKGKGELKRGRGSERQLNVMVMVESTPNPKNENIHRPSKSLGYVKMVVMDTPNSVGINYELKKSLSPESVVTTDGWKGYVNAGEVVEKHEQLVVPSKEAHKKLPWVHTTIANAKRLMLGVHHSIGKSYLQNYLNEFCYKLNRRHFQDDMFDRMIIAGANDTWF